PVRGAAGGDDGAGRGAGDRGRDLRRPGAPRRRRTVGRRHGTARPRRRLAKTPGRCRAAPRPPPLRPRTPARAHPSRARRPPEAAAPPMSASLAPPAPVRWQPAWSTPHRADRRRLRIAMICYFLPTPGRKVGGVESVAHTLAEGLVGRGHEVVVWSYDARPERARYEVRQLPFRRLATGWLGRRLTMGYLGNFLPLLLDYRGVDVVVAHGESCLLPLLGKPVLRVMHGSALAEALSATSPWRFLHQLGVYSQELVTALCLPGCVAVSQSTRRYNGFVRRVIPNGVD